jgi:hypothetical protein
MVFGFYDHHLNPDTGRPEPDDSWLREAILIWTGWAGVAAIVTLAAYRFLSDGGADEPLRLLGGIALFAPLVALRHIELRAKKRAWREALAAYEAAQTAMTPQ